MHVLLADTPQEPSRTEDVPLDWRRLAYAELTDARRQVAEAAGLDLSRTAPALELLGGVTGDELAGLTEADQRRARQRAWVFSAAYGVVGALDRICPHELAPDTELPGIGRLADFWAPRLAKVLPADALALDARDEAYAPLWASSQTLRMEVKVAGEQRPATRERARAARCLLERPVSVRTTLGLQGALVDELGTMPHVLGSDLFTVSPVGERLTGVWQARNSGEEKELRNLADVGRALTGLGVSGSWAYLVSRRDGGYLQVGGTAHAMTLEVRSGGRQVILGREAVDRSPRTVSVGGHDHVRHASEVFTAEEAIPLVEAYARGERITGMGERQLDL